MSVATTITQGKAYTGQVPLDFQPAHAGVHRIAIPIELPAAAPVANDMHLLAKIPAYVEVLDFTLVLNDSDSSTGHVISIGEADAELDDLAVVYQATITTFQAGGLLRHSAASAAANLKTLQATSRASARVLAIKHTTAPTGTYAAATGWLIVDVTG